MDKIKNSKIVDRESLKSIAGLHYLSTGALRFGLETLFARFGCFCLDNSGRVLHICCVPGFAKLIQEVKSKGN